MTLFKPEMTEGRVVIVCNDAVKKIKRYDFFFYTDHSIPYHDYFNRIPRKKLIFANGDNHLNGYNYPTVNMAKIKMEGDELVA